MWPVVKTLLLSLWVEYEEMKRELGVCDFVDLLEFCIRRLSSDRGFALKMRRQIKLVMVDEAQDTNTLQRHLVRLLAGLEDPLELGLAPATLIVVGDRKQAIYTVQGS